MNNTAIVIIDAQVTMFNPAHPVADAANVLRKLKRLVDFARAKDMPLIFVQHTEPGDPEFDPKTESWKIHPELEPLKDELVIEKFEQDAFRQTKFDERLKNLGIKNLILAGMQSEYCINTNSRAAKDLGYDVTLIADAHSTYEALTISSINEGLKDVVRLVKTDEFLKSRG